MSTNTKIKGTLERAQNRLNNYYLDLDFDDPNYAEKHERYRKLDDRWSEIAYHTIYAPQQKTSINPEAFMKKMYQLGLIEQAVMISNLHYQNENQDIQTARYLKFGPNKLAFWLIKGNASQLDKWTTTIQLIQKQLENWYRQPLQNHTFQVYGQPVTVLVLSNSMYPVIIPISLTKLLPTRQPDNYTYHNGKGNNDFVNLIFNVNYQNGQFEFNPQIFADALSVFNQAMPKNCEKLSQACSKAFTKYFKSPVSTTKDNWEDEISKAIHNTFIEFPSNVMRGAFHAYIRLNLDFSINQYDAEQLIYNVRSVNPLIMMYKKTLKSNQIPDDLRAAITNQIEAE